MDVPDDKKHLLVPSLLKPTTKAKKKTLEVYGNYPCVDKDDLEAFVQGFVDYFVITTKHRPVKVTWAVVFGCLSYQEIWDLVAEDFLENVDEFAWIDSEFDSL